MTPDRWARVKEVLGAALEKAPDERPRFLDETCASDPSLRREVESLLAQPEESGLRSPVEAGPMPELGAGQVLGRYQVEIKLGQGGIGAVYKAHDTVLRRTVALKVLRAWRFADPESKQRLMREARAASALNHPHIVTIHDIDQTDGIDFIAMEYVEGKTLDQVIPRKGLRPDEALNYAVQIADALVAAHAAGIVHRDIKPSNIVVSNQGQVKVLDFGLAKRLGAAPGEGSTATAQGVIAGTAAYMSPEQAEGKRLDARSDIFSFGSVLYEMVTGRRAFPGDTPIEAMAAILTQDPARLGAEIPRDLEKVITRCLRKDPARRFQHMDEVKILLEDLREEPESGKLPEPAQTPWRGRPWVWVAAAVVLIGAAAGVGWWWTAQSNQPPLPVLKQLTWDSGLTTDPAPSTDGKLLAFASDRSGDGNLDIWVQHLTGGEARRLTDHPADDHEPCFSPDGSKIAFRSEREGGGVYVVSALGGDARLVVKGGHGPRYSPDGRWIAYGVGIVFARYFVVPAEGGEPWQISEVLSGFYRMSWAPNGRHVIVQAAPGDEHADEQTGDWWVVPAVPGSSGPAAPVKTGALASLRVHGLGPVAPGLWLRDRIIFNAALGGRVNIWEVPFSARSFRVTGAPRRLTSGTENETQAALTGGARLVFATSPATLGLWELPVEPNQGRVKGELRSLTRDVARDGLPTLSADGTKLVSASRRLGNSDVWLRDLETGKETALAASSGEESYPVISRDGSAVVYWLVGKGIYSIPTAGGVPQRLCDSCEAPTDWSKDGTKVLFQYRRFDPRSTIGLLDLATGEKVEILKHAKYSIFRGHFSPDEHWLVFLAYHTAGEAREFIAPYHGVNPIPESEWIPLTDGKTLADAPRWSPDGNLMYYVSDRDGFRCIWAQRLEPSTRRPLGDPFAVQHFHQRRRSIRDVNPNFLDLAVAGDRLVFTMLERRGNIWMADFGKSLP